MTCRRVVELLGRYLACDLGPKRQRAIEEHLSGCRDCVAYLTTYAAGVEAVRAADRHLAANPSADLVQRLLAALRDGQGES